MSVRTAAVYRYQVLVKKKSEKIIPGTDVRSPLGARNTRLVKTEESTYQYIPIPGNRYTSMTQDHNGSRLVQQDTSIRITTRRIRTKSRSVSKLDETLIARVMLDVGHGKRLGAHLLLYHIDESTHSRRTVVVRL